MFKRTITTTRTPDRLSYLWLAIAAVLLVFTDSVDKPVGSLARASVSPAFRSHPAPASWTPAGLARQVCSRCSHSPRNYLDFRRWLLRDCCAPDRADDAALSGRPPHYASAGRVCRDVGLSTGLYDD